jgi:hypothetical protein
VNICASKPNSSDRFPDGRISIELEWLDVRSVAHAVVAAYVASLDENSPHPP